MKRFLFRDNILPGEVVYDSICLQKLDHSLHQKFGKLYFLLKNLEQNTVKLGTKKNWPYKTGDLLKEVQLI
jgi:hypothetical protein